jgi:hypothetical protein
VLIFSYDRPDLSGEATLPSELSLVGSGSYSSRQKTLYVWTPIDFTVSNASDNSPVFPIWQGHHSLFCVPTQCCVDQLRPPPEQDIIAADTGPAANMAAIAAAENAYFM